MRFQKFVFEMHHFHVRCLDAPYFESKENTDLVISGREGEFSATLSCVANGYPELSFDWINYPPGEPNQSSFPSKIVRY